MEDLDVGIGASRKVLKIVGVWPETKNEKNILIRYYYLVPSVIMFFFCNVPQTTKAFEVRHDFNEFLEVVTNSDVPIGLSLFKMLGVLYNQDVLYQLLEYMVEDWKKPKTQEEKSIMQHNAKLSRLLSIIIICLAEVTIFGYLFISIYGRIVDAGKPNATKVYYIPSSFFYDASDGISYEITWILQFFSAFFASLSFSSVDTFFAALVMHLCGQLAILTRRLESLSSNSADGKDQEFEEIIGEIVARHDHLSRFAESIEEAFCMIFLVQLLASAIVICLQGFQLMTMTASEQGMTNLDLIFMINFTLLFIFSLFIYCYTCEKLRTESSQLNEAAYRCDWYNLKPQQAKVLILIMVRANRPYEMSAGKFVVFSLELFCSVLKTCGGYVSMLLAVKDRISEE